MRTSYVDVFDSRNTAQRFNLDYTKRQILAHAKLCSLHNDSAVKVVAHWDSGWAEYEDGRCTSSTDIKLLD